MTNEELVSGSIRLTQAKDEDLELLMAWRSNPDVYRYFTQQDGPLTWAEHIRFWESRSDRFDWIISLVDGTRQRKVGSVNVSRLSTESPEIGVFIGEVTLMGKGIGTLAVELVVSWLESRGKTRVSAHVSKENPASQRLFESLGFMRKGETHAGVEWVYEKLLKEAKG